MRLRPVVVAIVAILVASLAGGIFADRWMRTHESAEERARGGAHAGLTRGEEARTWELVQAGPVTVPLLVSFLTAHQNAVSAAAATVLDFTTNGAAGVPMAPIVPVVEESAIDALLARPEIPPGVVLIGRYWRAFLRDTVDPALEREMTRAADEEPPMPYANRYLGHALMASGKQAEAAERLLREGTYFPERSEDAELALAQWTHVEDWDRIDRALADPRVSALAPPWVVLRSALRTHRWRAALGAFPRALRTPVNLGSAALAAIAALAWGTFCARLGGVSMRPYVRVPLYVVAFALGVASVSMTLALVSLEDVFLKLNESGDMLRDFLYFTFGVGLREELSKIAFFAPLLFFLRRKGGKGTRLDVLVCGALVGLGFAAEENLGYLVDSSLATAMARFLTANFFHMSMTAVLAGALDDMVRDEKGTGEDGSLKFSITLLEVAAMHGIYDFCLSGLLAENLSYFSMCVFVLLTRRFLTLISIARTKERTAHPRVLETFALGVTVVVGSSFVYASALVGPKHAATALAEGMLGLAIILIIFVQQLRQV